MHIHDLSPPICLGIQGVYCRSRSIGSVLAEWAKQFMLTTVSQLAKAEDMNIPQCVSSAAGVINLNRADHQR
jgi:hypothetical protein